MRRRTILLVASLVGALAVASVAVASKPPPKPKHGKGQGHHHMYAWHDVATGTTAHFRGLAALSANKAWVSGYTATRGVVFRTLDRGATWQDVSPAGTPPTLQFRDIEAFDANHAVVMSSGTGPDSQIYRTADGGQTWTVSPTPLNSGPSAGINALAFRSQQHGLAVGGDFALPVNSPNNFAKTRNGGRAWDLLTGAPAEYRSGATWVNGNTALAVGLSGSDFSRNGGRTWTRF